VFDVQLEDCAFQLYKHNGTQCEYSSYLDLETTLAEQWDELDGFSDKYATCTHTTTINTSFTTEHCIIYLGIHLLLSYVYISQC